LGCGTYGPERADEQEAILALKGEAVDDTMEDEEE
jgi:hypothetical protein